MAHALPGERPLLGPIPADGQRYRIAFETNGLDLAVEVNGGRIPDRDWSWDGAAVTIDPAAHTLTPDDTVTIYRDTPISRVTALGDAAYVRGPAGEAAVERIHTLIEELAAELVRQQAELQARGLSTRLPPDAVTDLLPPVAPDFELRVIKSRGAPSAIDLSALVRTIGGLPFEQEDKDRIAANLASITRLYSPATLAAIYDRSTGVPGGFSTTEKARLDALDGDIDFNADRSLITNIALDATTVRTLYRSDGTEYLGRLPNDRAKLDALPADTSELVSEGELKDEVRLTVGRAAALMRRAVLEGLMSAQPVTPREQFAQSFNAGVSYDTGVTMTAGTVYALVSTTAGNPSFDPVIFWSDDVRSRGATPAPPAAITDTNAIILRLSQNGTVLPATLRLGRSATYTLMLQFSTTDTRSFEVRVYRRPSAIQQSAVRAWVNAWVNDIALDGNADKWPRSKVPSLADLGGRTADQVDGQIAAKVEDFATKRMANDRNTVIPVDRVPRLTQAKMPQNLHADSAGSVPADGITGLIKYNTQIDQTSVPTIWTREQVTNYIKGLTGLARLSAASNLRDFDWQTLVNTNTVPTRFPTTWQMVDGRPDPYDGNDIATQLRRADTTQQFPIDRTSGQLPISRLSAQDVWDAIEGLGSDVAREIVDLIQGLPLSDKLTVADIQGMLEIHNTSVGDQPALDRAPKTGLSFAVTTAAFGGYPANALLLYDATDQVWERVSLPTSVTDIGVAQDATGADITSTTGENGRLGLSSSTRAGLISPAQHDVVNRFEDKLDFIPDDATRLRFTTPDTQTSYSGIGPRALVTDVFGWVNVYNDAAAEDPSLFVDVQPGTPTSFTSISPVVRAGLFTRFNVTFDFIESSTRQSAESRSVRSDVLQEGVEDGTGTPIHSTTRRAELFMGLGRDGNLQFWEANRQINEGNYRIRSIRARMRISDLLRQFRFDSILQESIPAPDTEIRRPVAIATQAELEAGTTTSKVMTVKQVFDAVRTIQDNGVPIAGEVKTINFIWTRP